MLIPNQISQIIFPVINHVMVQHDRIFIMCSILQNKIAEKKNDFIFQICVGSLQPRGATRLILISLNTNKRLQVSNHYFEEAPRGVPV